MTNDELARVLAFVLAQQAIKKAKDLECQKKQ